MINNKQIAAELELSALSYPESSSHHDDAATFKFDALTIRCKPNRPAIEAVAKKYRRAPSLIRRLSATKRYDARAFRRFCCDGEIDNAVNYNKAAGKPVYFARLKKGSTPLVYATPVQNREGYVVGRIYLDRELLPYNVYYLDTGMSCSAESTDKGGALLKFSDIDDARLEKAIKSMPEKAGFQQEAMRCHQ